MVHFTSAFYNWVWALDLWGVDSFLWIILVEAGALAAVVACRPKPMGALS